MRLRRGRQNAAPGYRGDGEQQGNQSHYAAGGVWSVKEKVYYTTAQGEVDDIRKAFTWVIAPSMQVELMNIVQFWIQRAENAVGLPLILQGQIGQSTPDTYKGQLLTNNNGNTVLR